MSGLHKCIDPIFALCTLILVIGLLIPLFEGAFGGSVTLSYLSSVTALLFSWTSLYLATLRPFFRKPHLSFFAVTKRSDPTMGESQQGWKRSWFVSLRISNEGQLPAKNCVGKLIEVRDSEGKRISRFDALNLYWIRQNSPNRFCPIDIQGRGDFSYLDLAHIKEKEETLTLRVVIPEGQRLIQETNLPIGPDLDPGTHFLQVGVYSEDAHIKPVWFKIEWWSDFIRDPPCHITTESPPSLE